MEYGHLFVLLTQGSIELIHQYVRVFVREIDQYTRGFNSVTAYVRNVDLSIGFYAKHEGF